MSGQNSYFCEILSCANNSIVAHLNRRREKEEGRGRGGGGDKRKGGGGIKESLEKLHSWPSVSKGFCLSVGRPSETGGSLWVELLSFQ